MSNGLIKAYEIETDTGCRTWYGDDEHHVIEQHYEAFPVGTDYESIRAVRFIALIDERSIA